MILELKGDIFDTEDLCKQIKAASEDVELVINSPGGDVFSGLQMVKAIENCKHKVTAKVEVMAASIAAIIALSCDKVVLGKNDLMMLHNCWTFTAGNKEQLQQEIEMMGTIDKVLHNIIDEHCYDDELLARVDDGDVWLTGDEVAELFDHAEMTDSAQDYKLAACASLANLVKKFRAAEDEKKKKKKKTTVNVPPQPEPEPDPDPDPDPDPEPEPDPDPDPDPDPENPDTTDPENTGGEGGDGEGGDGEGGEGGNGDGGDPAPSGAYIVPERLRALLAMAETLE